MVLTIANLASTALVALVSTRYEVYDIVLTNSLRGVV